MNIVHSHLWASLNLKLKTWLILYKYSFIQIVNFTRVRSFFGSINDVKAWLLHVMWGHLFSICTETCLQTLCQLRLLQSKLLTLAFTRNQDTHSTSHLLTTVLKNCFYLIVIVQNKLVNILYTKKTRQSVQLFHSYIN